MLEHIHPEGLRTMPAVLRIETLTRTALTPKGYRMAAVLFHERAGLSVTWTVNQPDIRLKPGGLVSPRYFGTSCSCAGQVEIARLVHLERPVRTVNLFQTVPRSWVSDRSLLSRASLLWERLPLAWQELVNGVLWDGGRFGRFCTGPGSLSGHHCVCNGNLRHMVETGEAVLALLPAHPAANPAIALAAALLHDVGKADDYCASDRGWIMTDHGKLNGHKQTVGDWIAVAENRMRLKLPETHYMSLRHALAAAKNVPFESGYRTPKTPEARLLSLADQSSGAGDLFARQSAAQGGWGTEHHHLGGEAPFTVTNTSLAERVQLG